MIWVTAGHEVESKVGLLFFTISLVFCILTHRDPGYIEWPIWIQSPTSLRPLDPPWPSWLRMAHRLLYVMICTMYRSYQNFPDGSCATVRKLIDTFPRPQDMYTIFPLKIKVGGGGREIWRFDLYLRGLYNTLQLYCVCVEKFAFWFVIYINHSKKLQQNINNY